MNNAKVTKRENVVNWDISDSRYGIFTSVIFRTIDNGSNGFSVAFTDDYAGMGYTWVNPGNEIPALLESLNFDYTIDKLLGSHDKKRDFVAENSIYLRWLRQFSDNDLALDLIDDVEEFIDTRGRESVVDWIAYRFEHNDGLSTEVWDWYETVYADVPTADVVQWRYTRFWDVTWPAFVAAVREHFESLKPQPKTLYECRFFVDDGWHTPVKAVSPGEAAKETVKSVYNKNDERSLKDVVEVRVVDPNNENPSVFVEVFSEAVRLAKVITGPIPQEDAEIEFGDSEYFRVYF